MNNLLIKSTENYQASLQKDDDGEFMLHVEVYHWSPSVYKEMLREWVDVEDMLEFFDVNIIYGLLPKETVDFASMFGWIITNKVWSNTHILVYKILGE